MFLKCGARVVVTGRNPAKLDAAKNWLGDAGLAVACDASNPQQTEEAFQRLTQTFGALHGVYHVAGGSGRRAYAPPRLPPVFHASGALGALEVPATSSKSPTRRATSVSLRESSAGS